MYRFVIEHPRWISPERLATLDVRAGAAMGRIYRVVPEDRPLRAVPNLDALTTPELALAIESPNGTLRDNVQRVLVHRGDHAAAPLLARLVRESALPECRAQALGALDGLGDLDDATILKALADTHLGVRRQAARLAAPRLAANAELGRSMLALADDPEITVRLQVALSLGEWPAPEAGRAHRRDRHSRRGRSLGPRGGPQLGRSARPNGVGTRRRLGRDRRPADRAGRASDCDDRRHARPGGGRLGPEGGRRRTSKLAAGSDRRIARRLLRRFPGRRLVRPSVDRRLARWPPIRRLRRPTGLLLCGCWVDWRRAATPTAR